MRLRRSSALATLGAATLLTGALAPAAHAAPITADPGGTLTRVSLTSDGGQLTGALFDYGLSPDGRAVTFSSLTPELVEPPGPGASPRVFVRDLTTGVVQLAATNAAGDVPNSFVQAVSLSDGAAWVAFTTRASNMDPAAPAGVDSVYLRNRATGEVRRIAPQVQNQTTNLLAEGLLTPDAKYVALAAGTPQQIYRYEVANGDVQLVSSASGGGAASGDSYLPAISEDGTKVAFFYAGPESDLVAGGSAATSQSYVRDLTTGELTRISRNAAGQPLGRSATNFQFSANGRYVTFETEAQGVVAADTNTWSDVYRYDLVSDEIALVSANAAGVVGNSVSQLGVPSDDGRTVAFVSASVNLAPNDTDSVLDYLLKDMVSGDVVRVVSNAAGEVPLRAGARVATPRTYPPSRRAMVSDGDSFRILFNSAADNLVADDTNGSEDLFTYDLRPVTSGQPSISGTPQIGAPLTAETTGWDADASLSLQWLAGGVAIPGATQNSFTPTADLAGRTLSVRVRGTRFAASAAVRESAGVVVPVPPTPTPAAPSAPAVLTSAKPKVSGTARVGRTLRAVPGAWTPGTTFSYRWTANGRTIKGANRSTYKIKAKQRRARIAVVVTGSKPGVASVRRVSGATRPVR